MKEYICMAKDMLERSQARNMSFHLMNSSLKCVCMKDIENE